MTRKEAIMILENNRPSCGERIIFKESEVYEAMSMAIDALSAEPCEDAVSRQAAIDALDEIESEVADGYGYQYEKWRKYFCELPSAQPERKTGRWIRRPYDGIYCTACGKGWSFMLGAPGDVEENYHYCPNCGYAIAPMR